MAGCRNKPKVLTPNKMLKSIPAKQWACDGWIAHKQDKKGNLFRYSDRALNRIRCNSEHLKATARIKLDNLKTGRKSNTSYNDDESSMMTSASDTPKPRLIMGGYTTNMVYGVHGMLTGHFHPCERDSHVVTLLCERFPNTWKKRIPWRGSGALN